MGRPLANLLDSAGIKVVAISTSRGGLYNPRGLDVDRLIRLADEAGSQVVEIYREAEFVDVRRSSNYLLIYSVLVRVGIAFTPGMQRAFRHESSALVQTIRNVTEAERALFERGVLCLPDFVTNCGGVLGGTMEFASVSREKITAFIDRHIGERIAWLVKGGKGEVRFAP